METPRKEKMGKIVEGNMRKIVEEKMQRKLSGAPLETRKLSGSLLEAAPNLAAIVAVDEAWGIGRDNAMLFSIPEDMKYFREKTLGGVLIMGRKTLESFPGGKPLSKRRNIVLSRSLSGGAGMEVCETMEEVFQLIKEEKERPVFCVGGAMVYEEFLPYCGKAYITKMYRDFHGELFFPDLDRMEEWRVIWESEKKSWQNVAFQFFCYENQNVKRTGE